MRKVTYTEAAMEALQEEFRRDKKTVHLATDMNQPLLEEFGAERVRSTPISESAFVGAAIGLAGSGFRPVADIRMATFGFVAMDQMMNQAAKITYMFGGQAKFPILYRMSVGTGMSMAAQHSINPYPMYMNIPGLKIILPSTPYDVKGLLKTAIRENNPVISFEHMGLGELVGEVPEEEYTIPIGQADVKIEGDQLTIVSYGKAMKIALETAQVLQKEFNVSAEVIDIRTIRPLDFNAIVNSIKKTNRLVIIEEQFPMCSIGSEIAYRVQKDAFDYLDAPIRKIASLDANLHYANNLVLANLPSVERALEAAKSVLYI